MADKMINVVPLSTKNLAGAIYLVNKVFVYEEDNKLARINFIETLQGKNYGQNYWTALDTKGNVIGITGLYLDKDYKNNKSTVWLGWFGVHPEHRRRRVGSYLLEFTINEAKRRGFETMKIYTSADENERAAHYLYEAFSFRKFLEEGEDMYFHKFLKR